MAEFAFQQWIKKRSTQWKSKRQQEVSSETKKRLESMFQIMDIEGEGEISAETLERVFSSVGFHMKEKEIQSKLAELDFDGNGLLDFEEFSTAMAHNEFDEFTTDTGQVIYPLPFYLTMIHYRRRQLIGEITDGLSERTLATLAGGKISQGCKFIV